MSVKVAITQFSMSEVYDENLAKADSLIAKRPQKARSWFYFLNSLKVIISVKLRIMTTLI